MTTPDFADFLESPEDLRRKWKDFFAAFGRFIYEHGQMETNLNCIVQVFLVERLSSKIEGLGQSTLIRAVTGAMRIAEARDKFKRLLRVTDIPKKSRDEVDRILMQLGEISSFRDLLAHNEIYPCGMDDTEEFCVSTQSVAKESHLFEIVHFETAFLLDAVRDLQVIPDLLWRALDPERHESSRQSLWHQRRFERLGGLDAPWRYKSSRLKRKGPKNERNPSSPILPPLPSRE